MLAVTSINLSKEMHVNETCDPTLWRL